MSKDRIVTIAMPYDDAKEIIEILTRELQGHHNRTESYLVGDAVLIGQGPNVGPAVQSALAAKRVRTLRGHFMRMDREDT